MSTDYIVMVVIGLVGVVVGLYALSGAKAYRARRHAGDKSTLKGRKMRTITPSEARADLERLIDETVESHQPIIISGERSSAVLLSADDWGAIQETLHLLAVPGMRESTKAGMAEPLAKSAKELRW